MTRSISVLLIAIGLAGPGQVHAQELAPGPPAVEVTIIPGGGTFFTEGKDTQEASFGNYDLGAGVTVNFNRYVGVEGELSGALGISQDLRAGGITSDRKSPDLLNYTGNVVISIPNRSYLTPYVTGGAGGLTVFEREGLGISDTATFLTGNVGAGLKWHPGRWGLRGDYRFVAVRSRDDAPEFFGRETRYGHRVYAGILLNFNR